MTVINKMTEGWGHEVCSGNYQFQPTRYNFRDIFSNEESALKMNKHFMILEYLFDTK